MMEGGGWSGEQENEERRQGQTVLSLSQEQTLRDLHRKVKGTYMQLTQLLNELAIFDRRV